MLKHGQFGEFLKTRNLRSNSDRAILIGQKLMENVKIEKFVCDFFLGIFKYCGLDKSDKKLQSCCSLKIKADFGFFQINLINLDGKQDSQFVSFSK